LDGSWKQTAALLVRKPPLYRSHASSLHTPKHNSILYRVLKHASDCPNFSILSFTIIYHSVWAYIIDWIVNVKWILQQYENIWYDARLEVLTAVLLKIEVFCDVRMCHLCFQGL
jgi:hypothetical protein